MAYLLRIVGMLPTIHFDDQSRWQTDKVSEVRANRILPPETETIDVLSAQYRPKLHFGFGYLFAQFACANDAGPPPSRAFGARPSREGRGVS